MLGNTIGQYRRKLGLTQEQLAQKLEVTNQAVSKWEGNQCCPDVTLLPKLADTLGISLDVLFGRTDEKTETPKENLPWEDDGSLHVVLYCGHKLVGSAKPDLDCTFHYEGPVRDIYCDVNLQCDEVQGNVTAGGYVECGDVAGHVSAGGYVECGDVAGNLSAGGYVECNDISGGVHAGAYVECNDVGREVKAGTYVECVDVNGNVSAGTYVECGEIAGLVVDGDHVTHSENEDKEIIITIENEKKGKFSLDFLKNFWKED